jgi:hypothetical protein
VVCVHLFAAVGTWSTLSVASLFLGFSWISFLGVCNLFFVAIFTAEASLKLFSFGPTIYFAEAWNKFDCAVVRIAWRPLFSSMQQVSHRSPC